MARRRSHSRRSYSRPNPLTTTEMIVGGAVGVAVLGIGAYLIYQHMNPAPTVPAFAAVNQASGIAPLPGGTGAPTASQVDPSQLSTTSSTAA